MLGSLTISLNLLLKKWTLMPKREKLSQNKKNQLLPNKHRRLRPRPKRKSKRKLMPRLTRRLMLRKTLRKTLPRRLRRRLRRRSKRRPRRLMMKSQWTPLPSKLTPQLLLMLPRTLNHKLQSNTKLLSLRRKSQLNTISSHLTLWAPWSKTKSAPSRLPQSRLLKNPMSEQRLLGFDSSAQKTIDLKIYQNSIQRTNNEK